jgi:hypothetical protein
MKKSAIAHLDQRFRGSEEPAVKVPDIASFGEFLEKYAKARSQRGNYIPYSTDGRPAIKLMIRIVDRILGNTGKGVADATLNICGGAQWGKTVFAQNLYAYILAKLFLNVGYYLPDDDLVQGIVDTKFRPDVIDQIPWIAEMMQVGKAVNESGRQVQRKGATMVTDGIHSAQGYFRGMGKIPTSFSMDVVMTDERDDIQESKAKFLSGRMTSSDQRFAINIGTMRYDGAGQNALFRNGTQHICMIDCACGAEINPEENWPQILRMQRGCKPIATDPRLDHAGNFVEPHSGNPVAAFDPAGTYYFACPFCGAFIDREAINEDNWRAQQPERERFEDWSLRVSQLSMPAIGIIQIVRDWCEKAVKDPESMRAFNCDRLALPKSGTQAIDEAVLQRARDQENFGYEVSVRPGCTRFGGLDFGNRCWFAAKEVESEIIKRVCWAEMIASEKVRERIPVLFDLLGLSCLFVDAGPLRDLAMDLSIDLNGLRDQVIRPDSDHDYINFGRVKWDGPNQRWLGLRCATVEFTQRPGTGVKHKLGKSVSGLYYPVIAANREETIQSFINELMTPAEGVYIAVKGVLRAEPALRLPQKAAGSNPLIDTFDKHIKVGSRQEETKDGKEKNFVDKCENHLLLAAGYATLAETIAGINASSGVQMPQRFTTGNAAKRNARRDRRNRRMIG